MHYIRIQNVEYSRSRVLGPISDLESVSINKTAAAPVAGRSTAGSAYAHTARHAVKMCRVVPSPRCGVAKFAADGPEQAFDFGELRACWTGPPPSRSPRAATGHDRLARSSRRSPAGRAACGFWIRSVLIRSGRRTGSTSRLASTCTVRRRARRQGPRSRSSGCPCAGIVPVVAQHETHPVRHLCLGVVR